MPWTSGATLTATQLNTYLPQAWSAYSPSLSGITAATVSGRFIQYGKTVHFKITMNLTGAPLGTVLLGLPVQASAAGNTIPIGIAIGLRQGVGNYYGTVYPAGTGTQCGVEGPGLSQLWNATTPASWANTDIWNLSGTYEAA